MIGLRKDKQIFEIQDYFGFADVYLAFFVVDGASMESQGYQFIIHPDNVEAVCVADATHTVFLGGMQYKDTCGRAQKAALCPGD